MLERPRHPLWRVAAGTGVAYLLILAVVFTVAFVVPYLVFAL